MRALGRNLLLGVLVLGLISFFHTIPASAAGKVIKVGCAISFTGGKSRSGKLYRDAYDMAVETINKTGGVKVGNDSYQLKIIYYDDKSDPTESSRLVEKLIVEDKVNFLLGPYSSGITIPDSLVAMRYKIPMIEGGGASGKIFSRGNKYIFGTLPPAGQYFKSTLEMLKTFSPPPKTVAILYADDKFDVSVAKGTKKLAEEMGLQVALYEKYAEGASDFNTMLTKIKAQQVDVVLLAGHTEESLNFAQQAKELNVCPKMISMTVGPSEADFRKSLGKDAEHIFGVASWSTQMNFKGYLYKDTQEFVKLFKEKFNYDPDYHNASGIADVAILKAAIEKAGTLDPEKVRDAIASISLDTIYGHVEFNPNGQIKGTSVVLQILGGEVHQVYPSKEKEPVYPFPCWK
ncbi:branched-chain amino acid transport system substrate-binding protein [Desulfacinum hydrothermale DSM 13146]|uniref:Branched-chain amino acid transport system substrate-binding protein n=1 Tax=Desulfacinum hydrothermale DSM 13146 TaxID=1121390 RepID=A0A1W1XKL2_9BACT|nr:amino acid ABC transporter substrate-binding protein [Desulfacinum hydrothermale]SMC24038.1 branched-chain amino acid transport system substrate-binding protein [Desulfacinum hydrothermale DSM 13146]